MLKGAAGAGLFGIAGAIAAGGSHKRQPHPVFPTIGAPPAAEQFNNPAAYLTAIQQWAGGELGNLQNQAGPMGTPQNVVDGGS